MFRGEGGHITKSQDYKCFHFNSDDKLCRYNVEHRAAKEISRIEDPAGPALRAPMFHSDKELLGKQYSTIN